MYCWQVITLSGGLEGQQQPAAKIRFLNSEETRIKSTGKNNIFGHVSAAGYEHTFVGHIVNSLVWEKPADSTRRALSKSRSIGEYSKYISLFVNLSL